MKVTERKTSAQCKGELRNSQRHAEMEGVALGDGEFSDTGDGQAEF